MADRRAELRVELSQLLLDGTLLVARESFKHGSPEERAKLVKALSTPSKTTATKAAKKAPKTAEVEINKKFVFETDYQLWYSRSLRVVEQLLPDRYAEFVSLYRVERRKSPPDVETYGVADYIAGITVTRLGTPDFDNREVALRKVSQQIAILGSAESRLDYLLADIKGILEASLFDDELSAARELLKAKHLRSAGIIAGVVLERHLQRVLLNHKVGFHRKATLASLNDALKDEGVYDVPQWRRIQSLADVRNLCGHSAHREPSASEVGDLIDGVDRIIKSVF